MNILPDKTTFDHLTKSSSRVPVCGLQKFPGLDLSKVFQEFYHDADNTFLFESGKGTDIVGVRGSYWGAYNAVTEYLSYSKGRTSNNRMDSLWFGVNGNLNHRALDTALAMAN